MNNAVVNNIYHKDKENVHTYITCIQHKSLMLTKYNSKLLVVVLLVVIS